MDAKKSGYINDKTQLPCLKVNANRQMHFLTTVLFIFGFRYL